MSIVQSTIPNVFMASNVATNYTTVYPPVAMASVSMIEAKYICFFFWRLDAFHMTGLRYILKIEHSYYSRISNTEVLRRATIAINKGTDVIMDWQEFLQANAQHKEFKLIPDGLRERQQAFLGHLIRCDPSDPMRRPTIDDNLVRPQQLYKRVGQPRKKLGTGQCQFSSPNQLRNTIWRWQSIACTNYDRTRSKVRHLR